MSNDDLQPPSVTMAPDRVRQARADVLQHVKNRPRSKARRHGRRWLIVSAGVAAAAIASAAAAVIIDRPATVRDELRCYSVADVGDIDGSFPGVSLVRVGQDGKAEDVASAAISRCADLWRLKMLREGQRQPGEPDERNPNGQVPPLVACTLSNGIAAVFPGREGTCEGLGLPRLAK